MSTTTSRGCIRIDGRDAPVHTREQLSLPRHICLQGCAGRMHQSQVPWNQFRACAQWDRCSAPSFTQLNLAANPVSRRITRHTAALNQNPPSHATCSNSSMCTPAVGETQAVPTRPLVTHRKVAPLFFTQMGTYSIFLTIRCIEKCENITGRSA